MNFKSLELSKDKLRDAEKAHDYHFRTVNETEDLLEMRQTVDELNDRIGELYDALTDLFDECHDADTLIEELRATIEEVEATVEAMKPQTLHDEQKAEILAKLTVLDLETLQHLERVLGLEYVPPYS